MRLCILLLLLISTVATTFDAGYYCPEKFMELYTNTTSGILVCSYMPKKSATLQQAENICSELGGELGTELEVLTEYNLNCNCTERNELLFWANSKILQFKNLLDLTFEPNEYPAINPKTPRNYPRVKDDAYLSFVCVKNSECSINWRSTHFYDYKNGERSTMFHSRCCSYSETTFETLRKNISVHNCLIACERDESCKHLHWRADEMTADKEGKMEILLNGTCYLSSLTPGKASQGEAGTFCAYKKVKQEKHIKDEESLEEQTQLCLNYTDHLHHYTKFHTEMLTFTEARKKCKQQLATVVTKKEFALISRLVGGSLNRAAWVYLVVDSTGNWSWPDANEYKPLTYGEWINHQPRALTVEESRIFLRLQTTDTDDIKKQVVAVVQDRRQKQVFMAQPGFHQNQYLCQTRTIIADNETAKSQHTAKFVPIVVLTSVAAVILLIGSIILAFWLRKVHRKNDEQQSSLFQLYNQLNTNSNSNKQQQPSFNSYVSHKELESKTPIDRRVKQLSYKREFEIARECIEFGDQIGAGMFGEVYKGYLRKSGHFVTESCSKLPIAIKGPSKKGLTEDVELAFKMLVDEIKIMSSIGKHPNVLALVGANTKKLPRALSKAELFMIVEFCDNGNLKDFLFKYNDKSNPKRFVDELRPVLDAEGYVAPKKSAKHKYANEECENWGTEAETERLLPGSDTLTTSDLISFALQVAEGMDFISNVPCVHRDLAARNVLVTHNNICKVADFGLAKETKDKDYYREGKQVRRPIRWMSIEAIETAVYTTESDVWSYGVLLFEIFSLGTFPYSTLKTDRLLDRLKRGHRLSRPQYCHEEIYDLMRRCWDDEPQERPTFLECKELFQRHLDRASPQLSERLKLDFGEEKKRQESLSCWSNPAEEI